VGEHDPRVQRVVDAGARAGIAVDARRFPEGTHTAEDAARAIGCRLAQIVKTLVFVDADGEPVAFLVSGANRLDPAKGAAAAGLAELRKADARATRERTGFSIGGIPPFGHERPIPMYLDEDLLAFDEVWAAAGLPDAVFPLAPGDLLRASGARAADLKQGRIAEKLDEATNQGV
jgi:prolyl-tRNA editing enzyme YbaK/EbsC (Cys-tRNA(Pro) deacylase)